VSGSARERDCRALLTALVTGMLLASALGELYFAWAFPLRTALLLFLGLTLAVVLARSFAREAENLADDLDERTHELAEALEHEAATSEILRIISVGPTDLDAVLAAIAERAARLCNANDAMVFRRAGDVLHLAAHHGPIPGRASGAETPATRDFIPAQAVLERRTIHVPDVAALPESEHAFTKDLQKQFGFRAVVAAPLLHGGEAVGALAVRRLEARPFGDRHIRLLETFAAQAAIAIENVRLFRELQARTAS